MTRERYHAYLEALEQLDRMDDGVADEESRDQLRMLIQDVFLCREPEKVGTLLEQVATVATDLTASGGLSRDGSIFLLNSAIACGPDHPTVGWPTAPSLVAG